MKKIAPIALNKYVLVLIFFLVWMLFFDQRDIFYVLQQKKELKSLEDKKAYYQNEIAKAQKDLNDLQNSPAALEKFARERYLMKRDGEDIFIVDDDNSSKK